MDEARRFLALPRPRSHRRRISAIRHQLRADLPKRPAGCFAAGRPLPGTPAEAYLRARGITGRLDWPALRYHPSVYYRADEDAPLESWPALLAAVTDLDGNITGIQRTWLDPQPAGQGAARRSAPRARPSARQRRALRHARPTSSPPAKASRPCWRSNPCCRSLPVIAGLSANHLAALDLPPALRRLYVARDNDAAGLHAAERLRERGRRRHRNPRARAGPWRLQPRSLPSRPRRHAARISRISSSRPTGCDFCPMIAAPIRGGEASRCGSLGAAPEGRTAFVCGGGVPQPEKEPRVRPSRAAICRRRRAAPVLQAMSRRPEPVCNGAVQRFSAAARRGPALHRETK